MWKLTGLSDRVLAQHVETDRTVLDLLVKANRLGNTQKEAFHGELRSSRQGKRGELSIDEFMGCLQTR
ncbi:hypothetical protein RRG08_051667 [Elysia crispata]|uniref:Uncharacterized protein n=1 Tax=Elysia crispata TaxID=231223 RepID=A0AAE1A2J0_9GAST|nr:hypothetical protein RRG08_051667 [Elysia crispata]